MIRFLKFCLFDNFQISVPEEPDEDAKPKQAPVFVSKPEPVTVEEGEWARFCARVTGHPRPRVMWLINGHTVVNVSIKQFHVIIFSLNQIVRPHNHPIVIDNDLTKSYSRDPATSLHTTACII